MTARSREYKLIASRWVAAYLMRTYMRRDWLAYWTIRAKDKVLLWNLGRLWQHKTLKMQPGWNLISTSTVQITMIADSVSSVHHRASFKLEKHRVQRINRENLFNKWARMRAASQLRNVCHPRQRKVGLNQA